MLGRQDLRSLQRERLFTLDLSILVAKEFIHDIETGPSYTHHSKYHSRPLAGDTLRAQQVVGP